MTRKAGPKVFVVYEDNLIGTTLVAFLERNGYRATAFKSPLNALEAARSDAPDILVADVLLPDLSGVKLAVLMASRAPRCRVLLFSGAASHDAWHEVAQERGHDPLASEAYPPEGPACRTRPAREQTSGMACVKTREKPQQAPPPDFLSNSVTLMSSCFSLFGELRWWSCLVPRRRKSGYAPVGVWE
jgi:DNA-binding NtrC family response regulator